jgi:hypothetical protein
LVVHSSAHFLPNESSFCVQFGAINMTTRTTLAVPQIQNGKEPDAALNARLGFWLPPDSPYGNLQLKLMKTVLRADDANRRIRSAYHHWANVFSLLGAPQAFAQHYLDLEGAVYSMRRIADEFISMHYVLSSLERDGRFPNEVEIDSIGRLLHAPAYIGAAPYKGHTEVLSLLNDVNNAHKHSFANSDLNMIGGQEPVVYALGLKQNKLSASGPRFVSIGVKALVERYNPYYADAMNWLQLWSTRNLPKPTAA